MVYYWDHTAGWHLAEKSMERENAPWGSSKLHRLGLGRALHLAKSAPRCGLYHHCQLGLFNPDLLYIEIIVERGL